MDIAIVGRHTKVSDEMRQKIIDKMNKVEALAPRATKVDIHVVHERNPRLSGDCERVEITLHDHGVVRAEASAADRVAALELATARILDQLRKLHERKVHRHQNKVPLHAVAAAAALPGEGQSAAAVPPAAAPAPALRAGVGHDQPAVSVELWEGAPQGSTREVPIDGTPIVIRSKRHEAEPMSVADAIDQMELVGHDFFLFHDSESDLPSAVYRRRGWTYGVLHLEARPPHATSLGSGRRASVPDSLEYERRLSAAFGADVESSRVHEEGERESA